jgi:hypothetical protein
MSRSLRLIPMVTPLYAMERSTQCHTALFLLNSAHCDLTPPYGPHFETLSEGPPIFHQFLRYLVLRSAMPIHTAALSENDRFRQSCYASLLLLSDRYF